MFVALNKKEISKAVKEAVTEIFEEYDSSSRHVYLDAGDCVPIMLAKNVVGLDGSFKTSFIVSEARKAALSLFCAFMDETNADADKMIAIANFYENLLRQGKYAHLDAHYHKSYLLANMHHDDFKLMDNLDCETFENEHRLYIVTVTERFNELVRYLELLKECGKKDFNDIVDDKGFLHLVWKYDKDFDPAKLNYLMSDDFDDEEEDAYWEELKWKDEEDDEDDDYDDFFDEDGLIDESVLGDFDEEEDTNDSVSGVYDCYEEMYAEIDGLEEGITPEESESDEANPEIIES